MLHGVMTGYVNMAVVRIRILCNIDICDNAGLYSYMFKDDKKGTNALNKVCIGVITGSVPERGALQILSAFSTSKLHISRRLHF
jgi:hypothetical protein